MGNILRRRRVLNRGLNPAIAPPPAPTPGQTLVWSALTTVVPSDTITSANFATKTNYTGYTGEDSYARVDGARYGPAANPSWAAAGLRQAIPTIPGGLTAYCRANLIAETAYQNCGMQVAWFNFTTTNSNFIMINSGPDTGDGLTIGIGAYSNGSNLVLIKWDSVGHTSNHVTPAAPTGEWIKVWMAWEYNAPNTRWRAWYRVLGGEPVEMGTEVSWAFDVRTYCNPTIKCGITGAGGLFDISGLGPWGGSVSAHRAYALDAIETAELDAADIVDPGGGAFTWEVSASAVGGGDGRTLATAWTYDELLTEIVRGTVLPNAQGLKKAGTAIPVPTTFAAAQAFRDDCYDELVTQAGHAIKFTGAFYPDVELGIANLCPGVRLKGPGTISSRRVLPGTFTQPDAGGHPLVWLAAGSYLKTVSGFDDVGPTIEVDGYQFNPIAGANLAAVIGTLDSPHRCYVNADGIYFNSAGNPNTDGLSRHYFAVMELGLGSYLAMVEMSSGMIDSDLTIESGLIYRYEAGAVVPQYGLMVVNGPRTIASVSPTIKGGSYHTLGFIGQLMAGTCCFNGVRFSKFCPGPGNVGTTIAIYDPTTTGTGTIFNMFTPDCEELDSIYVGEQVNSAVRAFGSIYMHSAGGATNPHWGSVFDGSWKGSIGTMLHRTDERVVEPTCTAYSISGD